MAPKRSGSMKIMSVEKKPRKVINLETKLDIIKRSERGHSGASIARALGLRDSTVRTILKNGDRIKRIYTERPTYKPPLFGSSPRKVQILLTRPIISKSVSLEVESELTSWFSKEIRKGNAVDFEEFKAKGLALYTELTKDHSNTGLFQASKELYDFCKRRFNSVSDTSSDAASADTEDITSVTNLCEVINDSNSYNVQTANSFIQNFHEITEENGYSPSQIFTVNKINLFWKRLPVKEINEKLNLEDSIDHVTLLLGCNASGDFKLKPMLVNLIENPKALKGFPKDKLPVVWKVNKKAVITQLIFSDWFTGYFCPAVEQYCFRSNLDNKAILVLDNSPEYPTSLDDLSADIKVIFLPNNSSTFLHPMNESFMKIFKASYHNKTLSQILIERENKEPHQVSFDELWNSYDLKKAIGNILEAWYEIKPATMNKIWSQLLPNCVTDYLGFADDIEKIYENIEEIAKELDLQKADIDYFQEELNFNVNKINDDQWIQLLSHKNSEDAANNDDVIQIKSFSRSMLGEAIKNIENAMAVFTQQDPDTERSFNVCYTIKTSILNYRQLYREKNKSMDLSNSLYFRNGPINTESPNNSASLEVQSTNSNEPEPSNIPLDIKLEFSPAQSPSSNT